MGRGVWSRQCPDQLMALVGASQHAGIQVTPLQLLIKYFLLAWMVRLAGFLGPPNRCNYSFSYKLFLFPFSPKRFLMLKKIMHGNYTFFFFFFFFFWNEYTQNIKSFFSDKIFLCTFLNSKFYFCFQRLKQPKTFLEARSISY